jgi:ATP synthase protein I
LTDPHDGDRLKALENRIQAVKKSQSGDKPHQEEHYSQAQVGWRMVTELVAGMVVGFGIGYGLDLLLGTTPILMVLFIMFGFAAGVQTMMRTAKELQSKNSAEADEDKRD